MSEQSTESATSREQELLKEITFLKEQINKSTHGIYGILRFRWISEFDVIVHSRTKKGFKWTINVDHVTLEGLKDTIYNIEGTLTLATTFPFKKQIKIVPEKLVERNNGRGNLDYGNESRTTGRTIGLVEVTLSRALLRPLYKWNLHYLTNAKRMK
ncbi:hypothetical protein C2G38_2034907 [Gigaspora rosea]|uniref:Uncharacterized protein n=1 Tax=Gigaspora rosea TaxID=44941 RepID=A0A397VEI0_9GLOM|nr:hypothetical protein C2G38_2034907 [Gigaspora rosea]